jgi:hypothetical protein
LILLLLLIICAAGVLAFVRFYFTTYQDPYAEREIIDLSEGWQYETPDSGLSGPISLGSGLAVPAGEPMALYRTLDAELPGAAVLIQTYLQRLAVSIDGEALYADPETPEGANPWMALRYLDLPDDYYGKTLRVELSSPYASASGQTSPILMGTISSLEAYTLSKSMLPLLLTAMCLLFCVFMVGLTLVQIIRGPFEPEHLCLGIFAVLWTLNYVSDQYIMYRFFQPVLMSQVRQALLFSFLAPLSLYFYFAFKHYRKWMLPAVILHNGFPLTAIMLQITGIVDLPRLIEFNYIVFAALAYTVVLTVMEAFKKNRAMIIAAPFTVTGYAALLLNISLFYSRSDLIRSSIDHTYFLLVLVILLFGMQQFFSGYNRNLRESERLATQKSLAVENYERLRVHMRETARIKHDVKRHMDALRTYLKHGRAEDALDYLDRYTEQSAVVIETEFSDNFLLNAVAGHLHRKAEDCGAKVDLKLLAAPINIGEHDLYNLMSNITDNALEACAAMPEDAERFISLTVTRKEPYFYIRCENSRSGEIIRADGKIRTSKKEDGHGYGLRTIERIVEAYGGILDIRHDDNTFTVEAVLNDR